MKNPVDELKHAGRFELTDAKKQLASSLLCRSLQDFRVLRDHSNPDNALSTQYASRNGWPSTKGERQRETERERERERERKRERRKPLLHRCKQIQIPA